MGNFECQKEIMLNWLLIRSVDDYFSRSVIIGLILWNNGWRSRLQNWLSSSDWEVDCKLVIKNLKGYYKSLARNQMIGILRRKENRGIWGNGKVLARKGYDLHGKIEFNLKTLKFIMKQLSEDVHGTWRKIYKSFPVFTKNFHGSPPMEETGIHQDLGSHLG